MARKLTTLLVCLLTAVWSISQEDYPKLQLIDGDTIVLFTHEHVKKMNKTFVELDECRELNKSLEGEVKLLEEFGEAAQDEIEALNATEQIHKQIITEKDVQVQILTEENKKQAKSLKKVKKTRTLFTIGGTILGGVLGYLIAK